MNVAVILAGGVGSRLGTDVPKQYIEVGGKPIISYCMERFEHNTNVDGMIVVAAEQWIPYVKEWVAKCGFQKVSAVIDGGSSRQHSVVKGLQYYLEQGLAADANVMIHDAARPGISDELINALLSGMENADGVMPVLPVKDAMYVSKDGRRIDRLLNRSELYRGQSPEIFHFGKFYEINHNLTEQQLEEIRGCSELAYRNGLTVNLIPGDEENYKITTKDDLKRFIAQMPNRGA